MHYVFINSGKIKIFLKLRQPINGIHSECVLKYLLSCKEEYVLIFIAEIEGLWENPKKFRLGETHTKPLIYNKFV